MSMTHDRIEYIKQDFELNTHGYDIVPLHVYNFYNIYIWRAMYGMWNTVPC